MRSLFVTATALALLCGAALAQTSTSGSTSGANVNTNSGSQSKSVSDPSVNVYGNPIGNGASSTNSSADARSNSNSRSGAGASSGNSSSSSRVIINNNSSSSGTGASSGSSRASASSPAAATSPSTNSTNTLTLRNTPEIVAPSIVGGDPCTVGATGGIALPGFGVVTGRSWEGKPCERRMMAALMYNMGHTMPGAKGEMLQEAAVEVLCVEAGVRDALRRIGQPCVADRAAGSTTTSRNGFAAPKIAVAIATPVPAEDAAKRAPDWCSTASAQERRAHKACDG
jgi:hypothetical protein